MHCWWSMGRSCLEPAVLCGETRRAVTAGDCRIQGVTAGDCRLQGVTAGDCRLQGGTAGDCRLQRGLGMCPSSRYTYGGVWSSSSSALSGEGLVFEHELAEALRIGFAVHVFLELFHASFVM
jgi:hypothetical protein